MKARNCVLTPIFLFVVTQGLRKRPVVIVGGRHFPANARVPACTTDDADVGCSLIVFPAGNLDAAVFERQGPLALVTVANACAYATTAVVTDVLVMFIK